MKPKFTACFTIALNTNMTARIFADAVARTIIVIERMIACV
jgi:hypothetical protein